MPKVLRQEVLAGLVLMSALSSSVFAAEVGNDVLVDLEGSSAAPFLQSMGVIEGDVLTGPQAMLRGNGVQRVNALWKDGIVPFYIDPELQNYMEVIVKAAVSKWNEVAGIRLVEINPRDWDAPDDYLHFMPANGCASWVGRQGGAQAVWTGPACSRGSMMHEIGHALGLEHEHTRPDRDLYVQINLDNIEADKIDNFDISSNDRRVYGSYDYESIMHYGNYFFSANGEPTIEPMYDKSIQIGQRVAPSAGDVRAIAMMYGSDLSLVSNVVNEFGSSEVSLLVTNEHSQGANMIELSLHVGEAQLVANSNPDWDCYTSQQELQCFRDRLAGEQQSNVVLTFDQIVEERNLSPTLVSNTHDENVYNNGGVQMLGAKGESNNVMPLSDEQLIANAGSVSYSLGIFGLLLGMRLFRRNA